VAALAMKAMLILALAALAVAASLDAHASGRAGQSVAQPPPAPSSQGQAAVTHGQLVAGASGVYQPIPPSLIAPTSTDRRNPFSIAPVGENPQGISCPDPSTLTKRQGGFYEQDPIGGGTHYLITIYPTFIRNAQGGYDGIDPGFGYSAPSVVPPGGDASLSTPGEHVTAANIGAHIIAVEAFIEDWGIWQDAQPTPPYGGHCAGASYIFSAPFIAGNAAPPSPPRAALERPPFPVGPALIAAISREWTIGTLETLPGPSSTARTFVHIPTCAWLNSTVPTNPVPFHAVTAVTAGGYTYFLVYNVVVTPGLVTWDWDDGTLSTSASVPEHGPATLPSYDPTAQKWTDPCEVSHAYANVDDGRTITATEAFSVSITVSWNDGVSTHAAAVPCDTTSRGACAVSIGPAQGWASGPHPVDQIEPVPFSPPR
jgi:hypothetical protein